MVEVLGSILSNTTYSKLISRLQLLSSPKHSHHQFVDDTLIMGCPSVKESQSLKSLIHTLMQASNTTINVEETQILFLDTSLDIQGRTLEILRFQIGSLPSKFLGAPSIENSVRNFSWKNMFSSLILKLSNWNFRLLNLVAKFVLNQSCKQFLFTSFR